MIKTFLLSTLCLFVFQIFAQGIIDVLPDSIPQKQKVLILSFQPKMYLNDAGHDIYTATGKNHDQVLGYLRQALDNSIIHSLSDTCIVLSLLESSTYNNTFDIEEVYANTNYFLSKATDIEYEYVISSLESKIAEKPTSKNKNNSSLKNGEIQSEVVNYNDKYLNVKFIDKEAIQQLMRQLNADILISLNQMEIRGDFSDPYQIATNSYRYVVKVHFSVFDYNLKQLYGSYVATSYPSALRDVESITQECFPSLAKKILQKIPFGKVK